MTSDDSRNYALCMKMVFRGNRSSAEAMQAAADLLEKKGHCKGVLWNAQGQHCLVGALGEVADFDCTYRVLETLAPIVEEHFPFRLEDRRLDAWATCVEFNNHPFTTGEEVVKILHMGRDKALS